MCVCAWRGCLWIPGNERTRSWRLKALTAMQQPRWRACLCNTSVVSTCIVLFCNCVLRACSDRVCHKDIVCVARVELPSLAEELQNTLTLFSVTLHFCAILAPQPLVHRAIVYARQRSFIRLHTSKAILCASFLYIRNARLLYTGTQSRILNSVASLWSILML